MANILDIIINLKGQNEAVKGLKATEQATEDLGKQYDKTTSEQKVFTGGLQSVPTATSKATPAVQGFGASLKSALLPLTAVATAIAVVTGGVKALAQSVVSYEASNKQVNELSLSLQKNTNLTAEQVTELKGLGDAFQDVTTASDETVDRLVQIGANTNLTSDRIKELTQLSLDYAVSTGKGFEEAEQTMIDLSTATNDVATVMQLLDATGNKLTQSQRELVTQLEAEATEMAKLGDEIGASEKQAQAFDIAMTALKDTVGGASTRELNDATGQFTRLKNTLQDTSNNFGYIISSLTNTAPLFEEINSVVKEFNDFMTDPETIDGIQKIQTAFIVVGDVAKAVFNDFIIPQVKTFVSVLTAPVRGINSIIESFTELEKDGTSSLDAVVRPVKIFGGALLTLYDIASDAFGAISNGWQSLLKLDFDGLKESFSSAGDSIKESFSNLIDPDALVARTDTAIDYIKAKVEEVKYQWDDSLDVEVVRPSFDAIVATAESSNNEILEDTKDTAKEVQEAWEDSAQNITSSIAGIASGFSSILNTAFTKSIDLSSYEDAIVKATLAQEQALAELTQVQATESENKTAILEDEYNKAVKRNDLLSQNAIANQLAVLQEEERVALAEQELAEKTAEIEKQTAYDIAMAEYQRDLAEYNNAVQNAEVQKNFAIADASLAVTSASINGAVGVSKAFAQGGLAGLAAGLASVGGIVASVASAVSGITSSVNAFDSVKSSKPTIPQFAYGTMGYDLPIGGSAIVGERGAEIVTNNGNGLKVTNAENTANKLGGTTIQNLVIQVQQLTSREQIEKVISQFQGRSLNYAV